MRSTNEEKPSLGEEMITTGDGLCGVDHEQRIVIWNPAAEALLGYGQPEVQGRHCFEILAATDDSGHRICKFGCVNFTRALQREPITSCIVRATTKAGETIWLSVGSLLLPAPWRNRAVLIHLFRDVSQSQRAELGVRQLLVQLGAPRDSEGHLKISTRRATAANTLLSSREREVLSLLAAGTTTRQIAKKLGLSLATVRNHIGHILHKLHSHSRLEAVASALTNDLL